MSIKDSKTGEEIEIRCLKLTMSKEKRDIIQNAIDLCKSICWQEYNQQISDSRALEFIVEEWRQNHLEDIKIIKEV